MGSSDADQDHLGGWSWDGMVAFFVAARCGSLREAAQRLKVSQPTVGRRLDQLEDQLGARLLIRSAGGCRPTPLGTALMPHLRQVQAQARLMQAVVDQSRADLHGVVRVSCGPMIAPLLARGLPRLLAGTAGLELEITASTAAGDITIQDRPPDPPPPRARSLGTTPFAVYGAEGYFRDRPSALPDDAHRWVGLLSGSDAPPAQWLRARLGREANVRLGSPQAILEATAAGTGLAVLPCDTGEPHPKLRRRGPILWDALCLERWLVLAEDAQDVPRVRLIADRLAAFLPSLTMNLPRPGQAALQSPSAG